MHATTDTRSPTFTHIHATTTSTDIDTSTSTAASTGADASTDTFRTLHRLVHADDEPAVEALLRSFLAARRAVRRARREQAAVLARHEHELLVQRTMLGAGLAHLR